MEAGEKSSSDAKETCKANILTRLSGGKQHGDWLQSKDRINCFHSSTQARSGLKLELSLHVCITSNPGVLETGRRNREKKKSTSQYQRFNV